MHASHCIIKDHTQLQEYPNTLAAMQRHNANADDDTADQLWIMQHPPVFTQGRHGKPEHILNPHSIPVVQTDRGGQITYHGPGQLMIYPLLNVQRMNLHSRQLVSKLESVLIALLRDCSIDAQASTTAPGLYVGQAKIASIGLRIHRGHCYHGLALNANMDLSPFQWIHPCGHKNQRMTSIQEHNNTLSIDHLKNHLIMHFLTIFSYTSAELQPV